MRKLILVIGILFASVANAVLVGSPQPTLNATVTYSASVQPVPDADYYLTEWRNGTSLTKVTIPAADFPPDGVLSRSMSVSGGDIVCFRIAGVNANGRSAYDEVCAEPAFSGPLPSQPLVLNVTSG